MLTNIDPWKMSRQESIESYNQIARRIGEVMLTKGQRLLKRFQNNRQFALDCALDVGYEIQKTPDWKKSLRAERKAKVAISKFSQAFSTHLQDIEGCESDDDVSRLCNQIHFFSGEVGQYGQEMSYLIKKIHYNLINIMGGRVELVIPHRDAEVKKCEGSIKTLLNILWNQSEYLLHYLSDFDRRERSRLADLEQQRRTLPAPTKNTLIPYIAKDLEQQKNNLPDLPTDIPIVYIAKDLSLPSTDSVHKAIAYHLGILRKRGRIHSTPKNKKWRLEREEYLDIVRPYLLNQKRLVNKAIE